MMDCKQTKLNIGVSDRNIILKIKIKIILSR